MKKILIVQLLRENFGGVWHVNKVLSEKFAYLGYDVNIVFLRNNKIDSMIECDSKIKLYTINENDDWNEIPRKKEVLLGKVSLVKYFKEHNKLLKDFNDMKRYINDLNPNYIITSHYQLLDAIPSSYLEKVIHVVHCSFLASYSHRATRNTLYKYNGKINLVWLSKKSCEDATNKGYKNCRYIYNSVRFKSLKKANVIKNKKLVTIARFSCEKRIDLMVRIVKDIFNDDRFSDWSFEIYGSGPTLDVIKNEIGNFDRIKLMGKTDNPMKVLLNSSINLNTSLFEGFSLSILEANECGVPTVAFNFGESASELILNNKTGIIVDGEYEYKEQLISLMLDKNKLVKMSDECKNFNKTFDIDNIIKEWLHLFDILDENR